MSDYDDVKIGDEVYYITESRWMAFCRIKRIKTSVREQSYPDQTEYLLEVLKLPRHDLHDYFRPYHKILKHFRVRHARGVYFSGMWRFYTPQEFEHYYADYHVVMMPWARYASHQLILLAAIITICSLAVRVCYSLFR
jgi:hypothetical protein